jgi:hypothetical protein
MWRYARNVDELEELGGRRGSSRTAEQTETVQFSGAQPCDPARGHRPRPADSSHLPRATRRPVSSAADPPGSSCLGAYVNVDYSLNFATCTFPRTRACTLV